MEQDPFLKREELAQAHQLGALQQEYTIRLGKNLTKYGIILLIAMLIAMIYLFVSGGVSELSIFVGILGAVVLGGGIFGGALYYYRQLHVYVYTSGLLYLNGAKSRVARWEQMSRVDRDSGGTVTLWMKNERQILLPLFIHKLGELYATIEREIAHYRTPNSALAEDNQ